MIINRNEQRTGVMCISVLFFRIVLGNRQKAKILFLIRILECIK